MINKEIIKLASNTSNVGLVNKYSHKISLKNSTCGDKITLELITDNKKISSMRYETISCVYCEASASLLSRKIKNVKIKDIKSEFMTLKKLSLKKGITTLDESPHKIGKKAINNIIALTTCKPKLSTIFAKFIQSSWILCEAPSTLASTALQYGI